MIARSVCGPVAVLALFALPLARPLFAVPGPAQDAGASESVRLDDVHLTVDLSAFDEVTEAGDAFREL
ncbi:hypothetical protein Pla163_36760 [Planctomycetes bacterium Pla163]|uniref:Uncharacterized protein n=1 Tax=Rohdeia mirabilis TaxID=2528008 RepID=A0A518D4X0_9BACT|nr:hypothetical protein Pla163_36760 [Planctomycetes bacterium Pla163]